MRKRSIVLAAFCLALGIGSAGAQDFPSKPLRILIPYPPGGTTDVIARALQEPLRASFGQPVVIENRGGGAGAIAMREVMNAAPDGYTLVLSNNGPTSILPLTESNIGYRGTALTAVAQVTSAPLVLVTSAALPATDLRGFFVYARAHPGRVNYGTAGVASLGHVSTLLLGQLAGIDVVHIPYRGQGPMTLALVAGEVQFVLTTTSTAMNEHIGSGKLRALGVSTPEPSPVVRGAPPIASVLPRYAVEVWFGLLAPPGTPAPVAEKINGAVRQALALPAVQQMLRGAGMEPATSTPQVFAQRLAEEEGVWRSVLASANIKPE
ncbi:Bug family tripartite tricarboxylate transporter substrate binding protein [Roseomonas chloroacetimidivorans]|uniref:Bug family tripartite tricarboxylate transporter substrate binding protein n=1 Tax=Roseomonas chloroacetimidivorans TaxID=1766656 RepID=UPI003C70B582